MRRLQGYAISDEVLEALVRGEEVKLSVNGMAVPEDAEFRGICYQKAINQRVCAVVVFEHPSYIKCNEWDVYPIIAMDNENG